MVPNIKISKFKKDIRCVLFLNDGMGHWHISGAELCLSTVKEIGTVESRVFKFVGSVFWTSHIKYWNCIERSVLLEVQWDW